MNILFSCIVGSKLYGFDGPDSDTDIKGFCMPDLSSIVGLSEFKQDEKSNGLTGKDKVESVIYSLRKFVNLCMSGNPTVLEIAFADRVPECILNTNKLGQEICVYIRDNIVCKQIYPAFRGYFHQQVKLLEKGKRESSGRNELINRFGYDTKVATHAMRLGIEGSDLLYDKNEFCPRLQGATLLYLKRVRNGERSLPQVMADLDSIDKLLEESLANSTLPDKPDFDKVNEWFTELMFNYIRYQ